MRFAAVTPPPRDPSRQPGASVPASEGARLLRRLLAQKPRGDLPSIPLADLPADLDQRVRMVGEW